MLRDALGCACTLVTHAVPDVRQKAMRLLVGLAQQQQHQQQLDASAEQASTAVVDAVFLRLCAVVTTDPAPALRLEALQALAGNTMGVACQQQQ
jgi:hypothetical protein